MFVYTVNLKLNNQIKVEHIEFYLKSVLPEIAKSNCFIEDDMEIDLSQKLVVLRFTCAELEKYYEFTQRYAQGLLSAVEATLGSDVVNISHRIYKRISVGKCRNTYLVKVSQKLPFEVRTVHQVIN